MYQAKAHIHLVGIGGAGMSGIATILRSRGYHVSGCDADIRQPTIQSLRAAGCLIYEGNNTPDCHATVPDVLVYSSAIDTDHPEIIAARAHNVPVVPRGLMLAELTRTKYSIAIAGSHGKTTTTSLVAHMLMHAGLDPTVVIGGHLKSLSSNARAGSGDFFITEADESDRSLLYLHPTFGLVTNIDLEHLETYRDMRDITETFQQFLNNVPFYGAAILCADDPHVQQLLPALSHIRTYTYALDNVNAHIRAQDITFHSDGSTFRVMHKQQCVGTVTLTMPGKHNILNALGALALVYQLQVPFDVACSSLATFPGVERRFSFRGAYRGADLFDDYGHHPREIQVTLDVARARTRGRLIVVFQPHRYSRTQVLWQEFLNVLRSPHIDHLVITDIYAASEEPRAGISGEALAHAVRTENQQQSVVYEPMDEHFAHIHAHLNRTVRNHDLVLLLGAGRLYQLAPILLNK